jgi:hypothetical protein
MTNQFDNLLESLLSEMMPASMEDGFGPGEMTSAVSKKVDELPGKSQHWGPLQKLSGEDRDRIIREIINAVFSEKGNTYTPLADDPAQLKELIKSAISKVASTNPTFKASGKWAVQFLADRLANKELLGNVKYTTLGGEEIKKEATQKEMKQALNKALADFESKRSKQEEPVNSDENAPEEKQNVELVYKKAPRISTQDSDLEKAYRKLPEDKEMSWAEVLKTIGMSKALSLMNINALEEIEKIIEPGEEDEVPDLELDDEDNDVDLSDPDRHISPHFRTTRGSFDWDKMDNWQ